MKNITLQTYADFIRTCPFDALLHSSMPTELKITSTCDYDTFYAPFDYINQGAKIVIVGITPGQQQAANALKKSKEILSKGGTIEEAKKAAKVFASFSGAMRNNLVAMMDHIGLNKVLKIDSTADLFESRTNLVHFTSALRYPVFKNGKNFNGSPLLLKEQVDAWFAEECKLLKSAIYIPLGPNVSLVMDYLVKEGVVNETQVLTGLPHPSGANAERIKYFIGEKPKELLSKKTNPDKLDCSKQKLLLMINKLSV